jgi:cholesterol transport system auxiliary component
MKTFLILFGLFVLNACVSTQSNYYVLSVASQPSVHYANKGRVIGVEKVTVPAYLYKRELAIAKSSSQIVLLDNAVWGEDLDVGLTARLIGFLQKKFNQPNVYAYPWGLDKQPTVRVSVHVTRFIAQGNKVYLDATWSVENLKTKRRKAKLFTTSVNTSLDTQSIVASMDKAFIQFEEEVARGINF